MKVLAIHPAATFPLLTEPEIAKLAIDIKNDGLVNPIVLCDGKVLDGRARLDACSRARVEPRFFNYAGEDPVAFVTQANGGRQLTPGQRALTAARVAKAWKEQTVNRSDVSPDTSRVSGDTRIDNSWRAARQFGLSKSTVCRAERLLEKATADTIAAVEEGRLRVNEALREIQGPAAPIRPAKSSLQVIAASVERVEKKANLLRDELRELCTDTRARRLLEDTLLDLAKDFYAIAETKEMS